MGLLSLGMETHRNKTYLDWEDIDSLVDSLVSTIERYKVINPNLIIGSVYGIPRGGLILAVMLSHRLGVPLLTDWTLIDSYTLIVDDIADSGVTLSKYSGNLTATLLYKPHTSCFTPTFFGDTFTKDNWVVFPWESKDSLPDR